MKKSLIALAVLAAAGAASAQSSVTLFGVVDATLQNIKGDGNGSVTRLHNSGYNSSRLGFRGTEDLGGGMSASFWLEAGLSNDDGTMAASSSTNQAIAAFVPATGANAPVRSGTQGLTFNRRSTVSLAGGWGELRLGRDYVPAFWNLTVFDPFGTNGVGSGSNLSLGLGTATGVPTTVRASNSIGYFLPGNMGGFYGQVMYALGENASNVGVSEDAGNHVGFRVGYANGPLNVALGYGNTDIMLAGVAAEYKNVNLGASYNFGGFSLMGIFQTEKLEAAGSVDSKVWQIGGSVPLGAGEIRASVGRAKIDVAPDPTGTQVSIGYVHNLSKRTAVYTTYSRINNKDGGQAFFSNGRPATTADGNTSGFEVGVRHAF